MSEGPPGAPGDPAGERREPRPDDTRVVTVTERRNARPADQVLYGDELSPGARASEYVILGTLAVGGCGTVYHGQHRILGRRAAVKVLHRELATSAVMVERFLREARAVNLIRHPNIVDIYEFGEFPDGRPFYVMEYLEGTNLETFLQQQGALAPSHALEILEPVCQALSAAHGAGVVHRDLKANNIFVTSDVPPSIKLLDFGLAKLQHEPSEGLTSVGTRLGTPLTMAPEQIRGEAVDGRTDIYALGVLLFRVLTGQYPFMADDQREIERLHLEAPVPHPSQLAPVWASIDAVVRRCMEKQREQRFESVAAFLTAFADAVSDPRTREGGRPRALPAIGIYADVRIDEQAHEDMDDALLDDLAAVLDRLDARLREAGYVLPLQTGSSLLAARLLPADPAEATAARRQALTLATSLSEELSARNPRDPRIRVSLCLHVDRAVVRGAETVVVGGPLVRIATWAPHDELAAVVLTREMAAGLALEGLPEISRYRVLLPY
jgi:serine/threonine-protein kinase